MINKAQGSGREQELSWISLRNKGNSRREPTWKGISSQSWLSDTVREGMLETHWMVESGLAHSQAVA